MSSSITVDPDDREEGEIVDDENVFEDISDNSISDIEGPICSGKSVLHKENLRTISLSSVSDGENLIAIRVQNHHGHKNRRRRRSRSEKRNAYLKRRNSSGHSSDSDYSSREKKRLKKQLKEAVRIDTTSSSHNSLRDRLQAMVKLNDDSQIKESEHENTTAAPDIELVQEVNVNSEKILEYDKELQELRLEALKTAILNKHRHRKKRTLKETDEIVVSDSSQKSDVLETNKENSGINNNIGVTNKGGLECVLPTNISCDNVNNIPMSDLPSPSEEDADALRALLLASMSNKTTAPIKVDETYDSIKNKVIEIKTVHSSTSIQVDKKDPEVKQTAQLKDANTTVKSASRSSIKKITSTKIIRQHFLMPICPNLDSPSKKLPVKNSNIAFSNKKLPIKSHVALTKNGLVNGKHRYPPTTLITDASVFPPVKPLIINVDSDSDSEEDLIILDDVGKNDKVTARPKENLERPESADVTLPIEIQNSLEHLLKEERAKVEAELANKTPQKSNNNIEVLEKSVVKLLPPDKQIEYRNLISKIRTKVNKTLLLDSVNPLDGTKKLSGHTFVNNKVDTTKSSQVKWDLPKAIDKKACSGSGTARPANVSIATGRNLVQQIERKVLPVTSTKPSGAYLTNPVKKSVKIVNSVNREVKLTGITCKVASNTAISNVGVTTGSVLQSTNGKLQCENSKLGSNCANKLELARFRLARKDIYVQSDGRLQIKAQYQTLNSLIKQINNAGAEKRKHELHVTKLLEELCQAQKQVSQCNASYVCLVKEFVNKKDIIDKSTKQVVQEKLTTTKETTIKDISKLNSTCPTQVVQENLTTTKEPTIKDISKLNSTCTAKVVQEKLTTTKEPTIKDISKLNSTCATKVVQEKLTTTKDPTIKDIKLISTCATTVVQEKLTTTKEPTIKDISKLSSTCPIMAVVGVEGAKAESATNDGTASVNSQSVDSSKVITIEVVNPDCEIIVAQEKCSKNNVTQDSLVPTTNNEIDKILESSVDNIDVGNMESDATTEVCGSYVSPLGKFSRCEAVDPLGVLCPYEVTGSCRDPECKFTHFSANSVETR